MCRGKTSGNTSWSLHNLSRRPLTQVERSLSTAGLAFQGALRASLLISCLNTDSISSKLWAWSDKIGWSRIQTRASGDNYLNSGKKCSRYTRHPTFRQSPCQCPYSRQLKIPCLLIRMLSLPIVKYTPKNHQASLLKALRTNSGGSHLITQALAER